MGESRCRSLARRCASFLLPEPRASWGRCLTPSVPNVCVLVLGLASLPLLTLSYGDDELRLSEGLAFLMLLGLPVLGTGILHFRLVPLRPGDFTHLSRGATRLLFVTAFFLLWLDAGPVVLALGLESGTWWAGYVLVPGIATGLLLLHARAIGPGPTRRVLAALWIWSAALPWIPWNENKADALRFLSVAGGTVEDVQVAFADIPWSCRVVRGDEPSVEVALADIPPRDFAELTELRMGPYFGGASIYLREGRVEGFWFHYD